MNCHRRKENARDFIADSRKKRSIGTWLIEYNVYGIVTLILVILAGISKITHKIDQRMNDI